jgi:hypothetical protein
MPFKDMKNTKKGSPNKEDYMMYNDSSFETNPLKAFKNGNNNNALKKRSLQYNSNDKEKNYCYNQFNITNQIFNNSRKIKERNKSIECDRNDVKPFDNDYSSKITFNYRKLDSS